jgi:phosphatidylserine/phosphatidylglycerophosphate/cardiolipin synthase-like enzyme
VNDDRDLNKLSKSFVHEKSARSEDAADPSRSSSRMLRNHSVTSRAATVTTYFDGIEEVFVELSKAHEVVVGAVAWLTNTAILSALEGTRHVAIVVQKEDFLRRDVGFSSYRNQRRDVRSLYDALTPFESWDFTESYPGQQETHPDYNSTAQTWLFDNRGTYRHGGDAVRCLGFSGERKSPATPRMHHKFLIFGHACEGLIMRPSCVVTGSFNLSQNAVRSRENVVRIADGAICQSYLSEWAQLWCMSEPLDWSSPEPSPEATYVGT